MASTLYLVLYNIMRAPVQSMHLNCTVAWAYFIVLEKKKKNVWNQACNVRNSYYEMKCFLFGLVKDVFVRLKTRERVFLFFYL